MTQDFQQVRFPMGTCKHCGHKYYSWEDGCYHAFFCPEKPTTDTDDNEPSD